MEVRQVLPRDAIPSIDDPGFVADHFGDDDEEVVALTVGDETRAYPVRILNYHEIVNDELGGVPVAVTWCPLCGSAVVYDRRVDGRVLSFGVSGKLADDDLVMYDRETESEWKQSLGEAIDGPLAGTDLDVLPASVTTWAAFREANPDAPVLAPADAESDAAGDTDEPAPVAYDDEPYRDYFEGDGFGLGAHRGSGGREWTRTDDIEAKTVVLGIEADGDALGFPLHRVEGAGGVARATVGGTDVLVLVGEGIHAYRDPGHEFGRTDAGYAADGATWDPATGTSDDGRALDRLPSRRLFAFAWQDDHGEAAFWAAD